MAPALRDSAVGIDEDRCGHSEALGFAGDEFGWIDHDRVECDVTFGQFGFEFGGSGRHPSQPTPIEKYRRLRSDPEASIEIGSPVVVGSSKPAACSPSLPAGLSRTRGPPVVRRTEGE